MMSYPARLSSILSHPITNVEKLQVIYQQRQTWNNANKFDWSQVRRWRNIISLPQSISKPKVRLLVPVLRAPGRGGQKELLYLVYHYRKLSRRYLIHQSSSYFFFLDTFVCDSNKLCWNSQIIILQWQLGIRTKSSCTIIAVMRDNFQHLHF